MILEAKELLDDADVPDDGLRQMTLDSAQWNDIFNITGFTSRDFVQNVSPLETGSLPSRVIGFNPKLATSSGTGTPDVSYFYHPIFMQVAVQKSLLVEVFNQGAEGKRSRRINSTLLWGVTQFSNLRVVTIS